MDRREERKVGNITCQCRGVCGPGSNPDHSSLRLGCTFSLPLSPRFFSKIDRDGGGSVDENEFIELFNEHLPTDFEEFLSVIFINSMHCNRLC